MQTVAPPYDVIAFGEGLLRLSPGRYERLEQASLVDVHVAGDAPEVATGLCRFGRTAAWISVLPDTPPGRKIANKVREHGVDTSGVFWTPEGRVGLIYVEPGSAPRATQTIEDADDTAFRRMQTGRIDWSMLGRGRIFHLSYAPPDKTNRRVVEEAAAAAQRHGCRLSVGVAAVPEPDDPALAALLEQADILGISERSARVLMGEDLDPGALAVRLRDRFKTDVVALAAGRLHTPRMGTWTGVAAAETVYEDRVYEIEVIDAAGSFNAFIAGFLTGYIAESPEKGLRYGNAAAALAHSVPGNLSWIGLEEVRAQLSGQGAGLQR